MHPRFDRLELRVKPALAAPAFELESAVAQRAALVVESQIGKRLWALNTPSPPSPGERIERIPEDGSFPIAARGQIPPCVAANPS
jgi:alpha-D-ribose 1-methylphosphonate 5-triphosphate synthase subunit PhnL